MLVFWKQGKILLRFPDLFGVGFIELLFMTTGAILGILAEDWDGETVALIIFLFWSFREFQFFRQDFRIHEQLFDTVTPFNFVTFKSQLLSQNRNFEISIFHAGNWNFWKNTKFRVSAREEILLFLWNFLFWQNLRVW